MKPVAGRVKLGFHTVWLGLCEETAATKRDSAGEFTADCLHVILSDERNVL